VFKKGKLDLDGVHYFDTLGIEVPSFTFYFEGGLVSLIRHYNQGKKAVQDTIFYVEKEQDDVGVEIALQYTDDIDAKIIPFANNIYNGEGGTHVTGFKTALTRLLNNYGKKNNIIKESDGGLLVKTCSKD
jgi:DNA gyrase subunit B